MTQRGYTPYIIHYSPARNKINMGTFRNIQKRRNPSILIQYVKSTLHSHGSTHYTSSRGGHVAKIFAAVPVEFQRLSSVFFDIHCYKYRDGTDSPKSLLIGY